MNVLILYDGSAASIASLKVACQDTGLKRTQYPDRTLPDCALIVALDCLQGDGPLNENLSEGEIKVNGLLDEAEEYLLKQGFDRIQDEPVRCRESDVTRVLALMAEKYQVDAIYLPTAEEDIHYKQGKKKGSLFSRWFRTNPGSTSTVPTANRAGIANLVFTSMLARTVKCRIVLTDPQGIVSRLSYSDGFNRNGLKKMAEYSLIPGLKDGFVEVRPARINGNHNGLYTTLARRN